MYKKHIKIINNVDSKLKEVKVMLRELEQMSKEPYELRQQIKEMIHEVHNLGLDNITEFESRLKKIENWFIEDKANRHHHTKNSSEGK